MLHLPPLSAPFWVAVGLVLAVFSIVLAFVFWWRPREAKKTLAPHERLWVEPSNLFPVFNHPDGGQSVGDHQIGVTIHNGTAATVQVVSWGIGLPDGRTLAPPSRREDWQSPLPYTLGPGQEVDYWVAAAEIQRQGEALGIPFSQMIPFARFGDGRKVAADRAVPMAPDDAG